MGKPFNSILWVSILTLGISATTLADDSKAFDARAEGRQLTTLFFEGDVTSVWARMSPLMQRISADRLKRFQSVVSAGLGKETTLVAESVVYYAAGKVYERVTRHELSTAEIVTHWAFDAQGKVSDFKVAFKS